MLSNFVGCRYVLSFLSIVPHFVAKPYFTEEPEIENRAENETAEFHCKASGNPEPQIIWIFNGKPISEAPFNPRRIVKTNSIVIEKLQKSDTGNYGCNATNSIGYVYKDVYVNVLGKFISHSSLEQFSLKRGIFTYNNSFECSIEKLALHLDFFCS